MFGVQRSRLKPVLLDIRMLLAGPAGPRIVGPASAGNRPVCTPRFCGVTIDAFPAKAGPTGYAHAVSRTGWTANCRTGFSREEASLCTLDFAPWLLTPSRLKPVPLGRRMLLVGPASAGKRPACASSICIGPPRPWLPMPTGGAFRHGRTHPDELRQNPMSQH